MQYRLKIVFTDSQELILENTEKHGFSDDLELFEVTTAVSYTHLTLPTILLV